MSYASNNYASRNYATRNYDDLGGADALRVHANRNPAPVVDDGDRAFGVNGDVDRIAVTREMLVHGVVDHLPNEVVKPGPIVRIADVHPRPLPHGLETLEHLDRTLVVAGCGRTRFRGRGVSHMAF